VVIEAGFIAIETQTDRCRHAASGQCPHDCPEGSTVLRAARQVSPLVEPPLAYPFRLLNNW